MTCTRCPGCLPRLGAVRAAWFLSISLARDPDINDSSYPARRVIKRRRATTDASPAWFHHYELVGGLTARRDPGRTRRIISTAGTAGGPNSTRFRAPRRAAAAGGLTAAGSCAKRRPPHPQLAGQIRPYIPALRPGALGGPRLSHSCAFAVAPGGDWLYRRLLGRLQARWPELGHRVLASLGKEARHQGAPNDAPTTAQASLHVGRGPDGTPSFNLPACTTFPCTTPIH